MVCQVTGGPSGLTCVVVWDLLRCLEPLIKEDNLLESSLLKVVRGSL